jgi:hypothetical protein
LQKGNAMDRFLETSGCAPDRPFYAIALFYSISTALGGITGPIVFGQLIGTGVKSNLLIGFGIAAALMIGPAIAELILGVRAERRSLESVATPLTAIQQETGAFT